jgi:26S proteasome regulatory subunit N6
MAQGGSDRVTEAQKVAKSDPRQAEQIYKEIVSKPPSINSDAAIREYETALVSLGELYRDEKNIQALVDLITSSRTVLSSFAKAKTAKLSAFTSVLLPLDRSNTLFVF